MSISTNDAPVTRATAVMNSAIRVTGARQRACDARRIAEIRVPAWLIPMKNTNSEMYNPHEIRSRMAVTTRPCRHCWV